LSKWCELVETVKARHQQAGIDGAGGGRGHVDLSDHRHPSGVRNIPGGKAPARLPHQDDPIGPRSTDAHEAAQSEVARVTHDHEGDAVVPGGGQLIHPRGVDDREDVVVGQLELLVTRMGWRLPARGVGSPNSAAATSGSAAASLVGR
jgi:hypothetical protein